jgi:hypothetical protein
MSALLFTVLAICALVLVRNKLVYSITRRRLDEIHRENHAAINAGTFTDAMLARYDEMPSHDSMLFDLRKWTYRQFYQAGSQP